MNKLPWPADALLPFHSENPCSEKQAAFVRPLKIIADASKFAARRGQNRVFS
jgi:hypothetical protein